MAIPEAQLQTWSNPGASVTAKATHEAIRRCLARDESRLRGRDYEVYLQGSYKNDTNIRGDSDVDVVVQLNGIYYYDFSSLTPLEAHLAQAGLPPATDSFQSFRQDLISTMSDCFTTLYVQPGEKAIKLAAVPGRIPADVIPCVQYRRYFRSAPGANMEFVEGMKFFAASTGREIINYPKRHYDNGVLKNGLFCTLGNYKMIVRMFKNARCVAIDKGLLRANAAPSYFVECFLYNVPDNLFSGNLRNSFRDIVHWMNSADFDLFTCQNRQTYLFGATPEQWNQVAARGFLQALISLWNNWS